MFYTGEFEPGDGTRYQVAYELLPGRRFFFAFGVDTEPLRGHVWERNAHPDFTYYSEKVTFRRDERANTTTLLTGFRVLSWLLGIAVDAHAAGLATHLLRPWVDNWHEQLLPPSKEESRG